MAIIANENKGYTQDEFKDYLKTTIDAIVPQVSELKTSAEQSATDSASSATSAANSAKQSATSAANSEASNQQSKKWASATESPDGVVDTDSPTGKTQSSRSWALYSKDRSDSAASSATASANSATEAATHEANAAQSLVASQNIQKEVEDGLKKVSSVVTYRGTVDNFSSLPTGLTSDNTGDMYNIKNAGGTDSSGNEIKAGDNVVWNGSDWDDQSGHVDLSDYYTKEEIGKSVLSIVANNDTLTFIHRDATKDSLTINNVGHATKASQDGNGNNIATTYETKASHASDINSINNTINTKCLSSLTVTDASITATTVDGTTSTATVNNIDHATTATNDANGNNIADTYETKADATNTYNSITSYTNRLQRNKAYSVGDIAYSSYLPSWARLECVTAGTTADTVPSSMVTVSSGGVLISDGTVTWIVDDVRDMTPVGCVRGSLFLPKGYIKANGAIVQRADYPRLVHFINSNNLWTDDMVHNAGLFGVGDESSTFVLPDYRERMLQYADESIGKHRNAGLPNIWGYFAISDNVARNESVSSALSVAGGCMKTTAFSHHIVYLNTGTNGVSTASVYDQVNFDASTYNGIYGSSTTVQPPAINVIPIIRY